MEKKYEREVNSFQNLWKGGYFGENNQKRNQLGIEKYLKENISKELTILEIGCGRGRWSKFINEELNPKQFTCIDVLSAEHNNFWNYVGVNNNNIIYHQVKNFLLEDIPNNSLDFVFSYDVWCHISESSQKLYLENLYKKCKPGAKLFIMYSDPRKYFKNEPENIWFIKTYLPKEKLININENENEKLFKLAIDDSDGEPIEGRWYWIGKEKFINNLLDYNYKIIEEDLDIDKTNIITLFEK